MSTCQNVGYPGQLTTISKPLQGTETKRKGGATKILRCHAEVVVKMGFRLRAPSGSGPKTKTRKIPRVLHSARTVVHFLGAGRLSWLEARRTVTSEVVRSRFVKWKSFDTLPLLENRRILVRVKDWLARTNPSGSISNSGSASRAE